MKLLSKIFFISMLFTVVSCYELDLQDNPNSVPPERADINFFYNNVQLSYGSFIQNTSDLVSVFVRQRAMTGGNTYQNQYSPGTFDGTWRSCYADLLPDIQAITDIANERGLVNHLGIVQTMKAHILMTMVDMFGDIPYSQATLGTDNISPAADAAKDVYAAALTLLNEATTNLDAGAASVDNDLYFGGDADQWRKAANTLKIKLYLNLRLTDAATATAGINEIISSGNFIAAAADDFKGEYGTRRTNDNMDSRHPWYQGHYETGGPYMSNYFMWSLLDEKGFEDPRLRYYFLRQDCYAFEEDAFTLQCATAPEPLHYTGDYPFCVASYELGYWGRDHGDDAGIPPDNVKRTTYGLYPAGGAFDNGIGMSADGPCYGGVQNQGVDGAKGQGITPIMMSSYTHFMLAEAALTLGTAGDPRAYLEEGVRQSISTVAGFGSRTEVDPAYAINDSVTTDYVDYVLAAYDGAGSDDERLGVIIKEYHIASWGSGMEAYNAYRRTSHPKGMQPTREPVSGDFPRTNWYPNNYVNQNSSASQRSVLSGKVFWDTNPDVLD